MLPRFLLLVFYGLALVSSLGQIPSAAAPPVTIDLSKFPAAAVDEVVVPVPSEIFSVLDKLGSPNWKAEMRDNLGKNTGNRAQVALLLGTVIADGFVSVTPLHLDLTHDASLDALHKKFAAAPQGRDRD